MELPRATLVQGGSCRFRMANHAQNCALSGTGLGCGFCRLGTQFKSIERPSGLEGRIRAPRDGTLASA